VPEPNRLNLFVVAFIDLLNDMRNGVISDTSAAVLSGLSRTVTRKDGIKPVEIFPLRRLADAANNAEMRKLKGEAFFYNAHDSLGHDIAGRPITADRGQILLDKLAPERIELRVSEFRYRRRINLVALKS
jgi:hypothetical protein